MHKMVKYMAKKNKNIDCRCKTGRETELDRKSPFKFQYLGFDCICYVDGESIKVKMAGISKSK